MWLWFYDRKTAPKVWRKKRSHSTMAQVWQKIFHMVMCLKIPFHPYQPTFGCDEVFFFFFFFFWFLSLFFFFFFFFLPKSCRPTLFSQTTKHQNLILVKVKAANAIFSTETFFGHSLGNPPKRERVYFFELKHKSEFTNIAKTKKKNVKNYKRIAAFSS